MLSQTEHAGSRRTAIKETGLAEVIFSRTTLDTELVELATSALNHWGQDPRGRYGICFLLRITLFRFREGIYARLRQRGLVADIAPWLLKVLREELGMGANRAALQLRMGCSRLPAFQALGLADMFSKTQHTAGEAVLNTASAWLLKTRISPTDSAWLLSCLAAQILSRMPRESYVTGMQLLLSSLAAQWPKSELTETEKNNVTEAFSRDPRHLGQLVIKLRSGNDTRSLLRTAIRSISLNLDLCEDKSEEEIARTHILNTGNIASNVTLLATLLLRFDELIGKPAGREAAMMFGPPLLQHIEFLSSPYIALRQPTVWEQRATRALISVNVLLETLSQTPFAKQSTQGVLIKPTLKEGARLFEVVGEHTDKLDLSGLPEDIMLKLCQFERTDWNRAERTDAYMRNLALPILMRTFAAWAQPDVTRFDAPQAEALFVEAANAVVHRRNWRISEEILIAWLDLAATHAMIRGDSEALMLIEQLWRGIPQRQHLSHAQPARTSTNIGSVVCEAARGDPHALGRLKENDRWRLSCLVSMLDARAAEPK
ncbi:hypothetical protein [Paraburkholderia tropica]|uniref:hypothetical protein n=1 Tax=Paraburkholderia tropica TaxID=92647 RepID=UPI002ABE1ACC|nr:hypothetical protein [Paraburkholderia tropica]